MINWSKEEGRYVSYTVAKLGTIKVAHYFLDGFTTKGAKEVYSASCFIPGIKKELGKYETNDECVQIINRAVASFLFKAELQTKDKN